VAQEQTQYYATVKSLN